MTEEPAPSKPRRPRRSTAVSQKLERMRRRKAELDAELRDRQQREDDALAQLAQHATTIDSIERDRDKQIRDVQTKIDAHTERIARIRQTADEKIQTEDRKQAPALHALKNAGRSLEQIAALVDRPTKHIQRVLREAPRGRTIPARHPASPTHSPVDPAPVERHDPQPDPHS